MTDYQNELVMEHLDLVNWVIRTRISVPNIDAVVEHLRSKQ